MGNIFHKFFKDLTNNKHTNYISDNYESYDELQKALREAGLESSQLIVGIDFTKSNTWQGGLPYYHCENLHEMSNTPNPYQQVLNIMCKALEPFDNDQLIPAYGFGDINTMDRSVFPLNTINNGYGFVEQPCFKLDGVLERYNNLAPYIVMSGPTSFAPIIRKAIELVKITKEYHILLIIADGAVTNIKESEKAIIEASEYALSIICVGVGKGPWDEMKKFDDEIPKRKFDNFQFVDFYEHMNKCENKEYVFATHALMEIPEQYKYIKKNIL